MFVTVPLVADVMRVHVIVAPAASSAVGQEIAPRMSSVTARRARSTFSRVRDLVGEDQAFAQVDHKTLPVVGIGTVHALDDGEAHDLAVIVGRVVSLQNFTDPDLTAR